MGARDKIRSHAVGASLTVAALGAVLLTGCGTDRDDDDCRSAAPLVMFLGSDSHYHYGSPTGKVVPAHQVPASARKVPGYKAPVSLVKSPARPSRPIVKPGSTRPVVKQPAPAPAPKPAAPRTGGRR